MMPARFHRNRRCLAVLASLLLLLILSAPAFAGICQLAPTNPSPLRPIVPLTGSITVGRDLPIGSEIYRREYFTTSDFTVLCPGGDYIYYRSLSRTPYPVTSYVHPTYGARVYGTPIAGIGVVIEVGGTGAMPTQNDMHYPDGKGQVHLYRGRQYSLVLIKIANTVGTGSITAAQLPGIRFYHQGDNTVDMIFGSFSGQINIISRTCTTPDVPVNLGTHQMTALSGIGTGTPWVNVPIALNGCPPFYARSLSGSFNDLGQANQTAVANTIRYRVNPVTTVVNAAQGVMALQPDGVNQTATGIGIQIADTGNNPIAYNTNRASGLTLTTTNNANYTIPLRARYYQTGATPTSGQANGAATITLIYE